MASISEIATQTHFHQMRSSTAAENPHSTQMRANTMVRSSIRRATHHVFAVLLFSCSAITGLNAQVAMAPPESGIDDTQMRLQPLDNASPPGFIGIWEPYDDGNWLSFDLDFTTGPDDLEMLEARVRYLDTDDDEITSVTVGPRDLSFATLSRTNAATGMGVPPAYGETGGTLSDMGNVGSQCIRDMVVNADGQLVVAGTGSSAPIFPAVGLFPSGSLVARYTTAGQEDDGFDDNGRINIDFEHPFDFEGDDLEPAIRHGAFAVTTDALLRTWTGGLAYLEDVPQDGEVTSYWSLARLDLNGDLDDPFDRVILVDETEGGRILALDRDGGGRLFAAGAITVNDDFRATVGAIDGNGEIDASFGLRVAQFVPDDNTSVYTGIAFDSQDRLYATGWFGPPQDLADDASELEDRTWFIVRFQNNGFIDDTFGTDGVVEVDFTGFDRAYPMAIVIDSQDRIITVGSVAEGDGINSQLAVSRLLTDGTPDDDFQPLESSVGQLVSDAGFGGLVSGTDVALDSEGRIVISLGISDRLAAIRLEGDDGDFDESFGDGGVVALGHPDTADQSGTFSTSVETVSGNRVILGGCAINEDAGERVFATVRLLENGNLDSNAGSILSNTRMIVAFPDEALPDSDRAMPFGSDPPVTVEVELDVSPLDGDDVWTLKWTEIVPATFAPTTFADGTSYIFPLAPIQVKVPEPTEEACEAAGAEVPDPLELSYRVSVAHELRFGSVETHHRHLVQGLNVPSASNDQRYAYDIVARDQNGNGRAVIDGNCNPITQGTNANSYVWGQDVLAVAAGNIVDFDDTQPDNPSPGMKTPGVPRGGNTVTIDHGNGEFSRYSHMQAGSLPANIAEFPCNMDELCTVEQGDVLGQLGNSGNSGGPHLHFVLMDGSDADTDEGRPIAFNNVMFDGLLQTNVALHSGTVIDSVLPVPSMIELNPPSPSGIVAEAEGNDSLETHQTLTAPTTVQGTIGGSETPTLAVRGDPIEDIYRIEVPTRSQLVVSLTASPASANLDVYVLNDGLDMLNPDRSGWGTGGEESMTVTVPPGRYYIVVSDLGDDSGTPYELDADFRPFAWEYSAKMVCGIQGDPGDRRLARGTYATTVNIHNPGGTPALVFKKLALAYPPAEQLPGKILKIGEDTLGYDQAVKTDCNDIDANVLSETTLSEATYYEGFVVVQSTERLDVTAVYTSTALGADGGTGGHSSIDVEQIVERGLGVDLQIEKSAESFQLNIGDLPIHFILYTINVENLGPAKASDVRVSDELELTLSNALGVAGILPAPLDLPPTGSLISVEYPSETRSLAEFALGDIAAGTDRTLRFWAIAFARPESKSAVAVLTDEAAIRADEAELLVDDDTSTVSTVLLP